MRRIQSLLLAAVLVLAAPIAGAAVKVYDSSKKPGDLIVVSAQLSPTFDTRPGQRFGIAVISDNGTGTITLDSYDGFGDPKPTVFDLTAALGPGSFIFNSGQASQSPAPGQSVAGSTAPGGSIVWGILTGWSATGFGFCVSSPVTVCNNNSTPHGITTPGVVDSPSYDLGTWNFDPTTGDYEAVAPYINSTVNGGLTNSQYLLRGAFTGASLPALPLVGFGALAASLLVIAVRSLHRKR